MTTFLIRLSMLGMALVAPAAVAASQCPFIRPAGLSARLVDTVVVNAYAGWLHQPADKLDTSKTVKALDGTDNAILTYSFGTANVGEALGFDAVKIFYDAAAAKGSKQPFDSMTIADLQALARKTYSQGRDEPPPAADPAVDYAVVHLPVRVPARPAGEWRLTHCGADNVTFVQQVPDGSAFAASLRDASVGAYVSDVAFLKQVEQTVRAQLPPVFQQQPWQPTMVEGTSQPCADATLGVREATGVAMNLRLRVCYYKRDNPNVWLIMFSELLAPGQKGDPAAAEAFIAATAPK